MKKHLPCSLHGMSTTRWSARIACVKPFAEHLNCVRNAVEEVLQTNLAVDARASLQGVMRYMNSFRCILMASVWFKVLSAIDQRNKVLQAKDQTVDVEVANIKSLLADLDGLRSKWDTILSECQLVAKNLSIDISPPQTRPHKRKRFFDEESEEAEEYEEADAEPSSHFKEEVFDVLMDRVVKELNDRYTAVMEIDNNFGLLWKYLSMEDDDIKHSAKQLVLIYSTDISGSLGDEIISLKAIHPANLGKDALPPLDLLNKIKQLKLDSLFPNIVVMLRIFLTLPVTVAQAERSFSALARVKNVLRSTMLQERLSSLGTLAMEPDLCRNINFDAVIDDFANRKARKSAM